MKIALTILCSLLLICAQAVAAATPVAMAAQSHSCGCGGKMPCCKTAPVSPKAPLDATVSVAAQQILSPVPVAVVWVWAAAGTSENFSSVGKLPSAQTAPIYARHCVRLI